MKTLLALFALLFGDVRAELPEKSVPVNSWTYRAILVKESRAVWGLQAPVSLFAGQIHQESAWRPDAVSRAGARGLAQFTPPTAGDMDQWYQDLASHQVYSPAWSIRAMVLYNKRIYSKIKPYRSRFVSECDRFAMMLSGYNGGPGWLPRDRRLAIEQGANPDAWFASVERHSRRAKWAFEENRSYPRKIIFKWQPLYAENGWGGPLICKEYIK